MTACTTLYPVPILLQKRLEPTFSRQAIEMIRIGKPLLSVEKLSVLPMPVHGVTEVLYESSHCSCLHPAQ